MQSKYNKQLVPLAKQLRREMTKEERIYGMIFCVPIPSVSPGKRYWVNTLPIFIARKPNW